MSVADNLARIRQALGERAVKLVAVTKHASVQQVEDAFDLGVTTFGENRVQDALTRMSALTPSVAQKASWHFIGHLQSNKVKQVVGKFDLIHSVHSLKLASEISAEAAKKGLTQAVLLQVKVLADPNKSGFSGQELEDCFADILALPNLKVNGLMTISPFTKDSAQWTECFSGLKALRDKLQARHSITLSELSMGMTDDYPEAIKCGATMIRLGRALFD